MWPDNSLFTLLKETSMWFIDIYYRAICNSTIIEHLGKTWIYSQWSNCGVFSVCWQMKRQRRGESVWQEKQLVFWIQAQCGVFQKEKLTSHSYWFCHLRQEATTSGLLCDCSSKRNEHTASLYHTHRSQQLTRQQCDGCRVTATSWRIPGSPRGQQTITWIPLNRWGALLWRRSTCSDGVWLLW